MSDAVTALPILALDASTLGDLDADLDREWLVTNGLGGYAMGTICGATTRSYHGLLVAATRPPTERHVFIAKVDEDVTLADGTSLALGTNEWASGAIAPRGFARLADFRLDGLVPTWTYTLAAGARLEKRVWMEHGRNLTFVHYGYHAESPDASALTLSLRPFCLDRDHHGVTRQSDGQRFSVERSRGGCTVSATPGSLPYALLTGPTASVSDIGDWYLNICHRAEHERGLPDIEDVYIPCQFAIALAPGESTTLVLSGEPTLPTPLAGLSTETHEVVVADALIRERQRQANLLTRAGERARTDNFYARLTLAADQFIVTRPDTPTEATTTADGASLTVIAGYPWFTDWGRDTMISLPGLTLATGRPEAARALLSTFARYVDQGMIPNRFPDAGGTPEYNTVDATLWYFVALDRYLAATQDWSLLGELFPLLENIVHWHVRGTRYGIGVDSADGLLRAGAEGIQLTWMDAMVDGWVVTPRRGKPVEINALWYAALAAMGSWARRLGAPADQYDTWRGTVARNFFARYWYAAGGYLYDVVDVDGQAGAVDWSLRPNQLFALALAPDLVPVGHARSALNIVERELLTPLGLRTLAPDDPRFQGAYSGDRRTRDAAYHQGTVWPWLLGAYLDAQRSVNRADAIVSAMLDPLRAHLCTAGIGTISEVAGGAPPFRPGGCIAQAWSVAEALRVLSER